MGENGEEKITSTQEIKDGKPVGEPTITTEVTKPAKNAIIRVGTKPETTTATATVPTTVKETETQSVPTTITTTLTTTEKSTTTVEGKPTTLTTTKEVPTTITTEVPTTVPTTVTEKSTEKVTETKTVTVTSVVPQGTTTVTEPTTVVQPTTVTEPTTVLSTVTKDVPTTVTVPSTVVVTSTVDGVPTTVTETKDVPVTTTVPTTVTDTTVVTTVVPTTVTNNVTTTEKATETTTATTTVAPEKPQVEVNGSTIEYWQQKGQPIAIKIRDKNVEDGSLKFRAPESDNGAVLSPDGRTLELPGVGTYTIKDGAVVFTPEDEFTGDVPAVEIDYTRTDGAEVVTPIKVLGHYNDCGCKTPENPEPSGNSETPKSSEPATVTATSTVTETPEKPEPSTVVTTVDGAPTTVTVTEKPGVTTVTETTTVKGNAGAEAKAVIDRCFGNAVRSPLLYLLPLGILAQVGGKIVQPYIASYQAQLDAFNAEIN